MKTLSFVLKRITQTELATRLGITKANITAWKINGQVPVSKKHELKIIKEELKNVPKRRTVLL